MTELEKFKQGVNELREELICNKAKYEEMLEEHAEKFASLMIDKEFGLGLFAGKLKADIVKEVATGSIITALIEAVDKEINDIDRLLAEVTEEDI